MPCKKAEQQAHWDVHSTNTSQQAGAWATINANEYDSYNTYGVLGTPQSPAASDKALKAIRQTVRGWTLYERSTVH